MIRGLSRKSVIRALDLMAIKAAGPPVKPTGASMGTRSPVTKRSRTRLPPCWQCMVVGNVDRDVIITTREEAGLKSRME